MGAMTAIRVIFDGKAFVPEQPVSLPPKSEGLVIVQETDPAARAILDNEIRAYYEAGEDAEDEAWARATAAESQRAWDED
jgi:hypothetical protein